MLKFHIIGSMTKFWSFYLQRGKKNHTAEEERVNLLRSTDDLVHICIKISSFFLEKSLKHYFFLLFGTIYSSVQKMEKVLKTLADGQ